MFSRPTYGGAEIPAERRFSQEARPLEPDPGNAGVGRPMNKLPIVEKSIEARPIPRIEEDLPSSKKVYLTDGQLEVPERQISLSGGEPPLRVYDTSGPQGHDVTKGLPKLRKP